MVPRAGNPGPGPKMVFLNAFSRVVQPHLCEERVLTKVPKEYRKANCKRRSSDRVTGFWSEIFPFSGDKETYPPLLFPEILYEQ